MSLNELKENRDALVTSIEGDSRFMSRITSIGLTPGCRVRVMKNDKNRPVLSGKKIALFGSYGWGDGQWMRDWEERCSSAGAQLATESVMANNAPEDKELDECRALGAALV